MNYEHWWRKFTWTKSRANSSIKHFCLLFLCKFSFALNEKRRANKCNKNNFSSSLAHCRPRTQLKSPIPSRTESHSFSTSLECRPHRCYGFSSSCTFSCEKLKNRFFWFEGKFSCFIGSRFCSICFPLVHFSKVVKNYLFSFSESLCGLLFISRQLLSFLLPSRERFFFSRARRAIYDANCVN